MKLNPSDRRELGWVALGTLALTAVEIGVFFALGYYTPKALYGAILSAAGGIVEMFLLAVAVTRAHSYPPEAQAAAKGFLKLSYFARMMFLLAVLAVGVILFNPVSTLITIIFPAAADEPTETETDETDAPDEGGAETEPETKGSEKDGTDEN